MMTSKSLVRHLPAEPIAFKNGGLIKPNTVVSKTGYK
jgi:hypothetical protein